MSEQTIYPVLCLAGATGTGKTGHAILLAQEFGCEVINTDSRQIYADFPIICAQPSAHEQSLCPHHLYGILPLEQKISAGEWRAMAVCKVQEILDRGHVPLLVGGTGMYFQALLHGIAPIPPIAQEIRTDLEARVESEGVRCLHAELTRKDPASAARIHPNDRQRIVRALEVLEQTGKTLSWWHTQTGQGAAQCVGPLWVLDGAMEWLEPRLKLRIDQMLAQGALEEAQRVYERNNDCHAPGWSAIGCLELFAYLDGRLDFAEARALWEHNTRLYAKRQNTWFRNRKEAIFFAAEDSAGLRRACACILQQWQKADWAWPESWSQKR